MLDRIAADGALSHGVQHVTTRNEGPFGWTSIHLRPPHLAGLVEQIWYSEGTTTFAGERVFPNGKVEIVVILGEPYRLVEGAGPELLTASVSGLQSRALVIDQPHMNADFRELAGVSPSGFLAARYPTGDGSSAAEMQRQYARSA